VSCLEATEQGRLDKVPAQARQAGVWEWAKDAVAWAVLALAQEVVAFAQVAEKRQRMKEAFRAHKSSVQSAVPS